MKPSGHRVIIIGPHRRREERRDESKEERRGREEASEGGKKRKKKAKGEQHRTKAGFEIAITRSHAKESVFATTFLRKREPRDGDNCAHVLIHSCRARDAAACSSYENTGKHAFLTAAPLSVRTASPRRVGGMSPDVTYRGGGGGHL